MKSKIINQSDLTSECFLIQAWGIERCKDCEALNTPDCGGERIRGLIQKGEYPEDGLKGVK